MQLYNFLVTKWPLLVVVGVIGVAAVIALGYLLLVGRRSGWS